MKRRSNKDIEAEVPQTKGNKKLKLYSESDGDEETKEKKTRGQKQSKKDESDFEAEDEQPSQQEQSGSGENDDEMDYVEEPDNNEDLCFICRDEGRLICCENCFKTFHLQCLKIKKQPNGIWECPYCRQTEEKCEQCNKPVDPIESPGIKCSLCYRLEHYCCSAEIPIDYLVDSYMRYFYYFLYIQPYQINLIQKHINQKVSHINKSYVLTPALVKSLMDYRRNETEEAQKELEAQIHDYLKQNPMKMIFSICQLCQGYFGVDKILDQAELPGGKSICFVKFEYASYLHCHWIEEDMVDLLAARKLKNFKEKRFQFLDDEDNGQKLDKEEIENQLNYEI